MARIRTVKPDFWGSAKTAKVSRDARLLFLGLLNLSDDEGRLLSSPKTIAGNVFPHDDDVHAKDVTVWMTELIGAGFVRLYEVDGIGYCQIVGFAEHQKVSHPTASKFPPEPDRTVSGDVRESLVPEREQGTGNREGEDAGVSPHHDLLRKSAGAPLVEELDEALASLIALHGAEKVGRAIGELVASGVRYPFPSAARKALEERLGKPPPPPPPSCPDCGEFFMAGTGQLHKTDCPSLEAVSA